MRRRSTRGCKGEAARRPPRVVRGTLEIEPRTDEDASAERIVRPAAGSRRRPVVVVRILRFTPRLAALPRRQPVEQVLYAELQGHVVVDLVSPGEREVAVGRMHAPRPGIR